MPVLHLHILSNLTPLYTFNPAVALWTCTYLKIPVRAIYRSFREYFTIDWGHLTTLLVCFATHHHKSRIVLTDCEENVFAQTFFKYMEHFPAWKSISRFRLYKEITVCHCYCMLREQRARAPLCLRPYFKRQKCEDRLCHLLMAVDTLSQVPKNGNLSTSANLRKHRLLFFWCHDALR